MTDPSALPLRDIHLPTAISWWPPAPGWWILLAVIILLTTIFIIRHYRQKAIRQSAIYLARKSLTELRDKLHDNADPQELVRNISVLIRRLSISAYPRIESASLTGEKWLRFLDEPMQGKPFLSGAGRVLIDAPYRREVDLEEIKPLFEICDNWITSVSQQPGKAA